MSATRTQSHTAESVTLPQDIEREILAQVAAQDPQAFERLYTRYAPRMRRYLGGFLSQQSDLIDEVLNDVMLVLWQNAARVPLHAPLEGWMCGIARRKALKALARCGLSPVSYAPPADIDEEDPERIMLRQEQARQLSCATDTLPPADRRMLLLLVNKGWSYQDIAVATGDPVSTVRTRVSRARRRLQTRVAALGRDT